MGVEINIAANMHKLLHMQNLHLNQTAAILGGGPSLLNDMQHLPDGCIQIAVNDHAFHVGIQPNYMVFMDDPKIKPELLRIVSEWDSESKGMRVTEDIAWTDIDLRGVVRPDARSGIWATWLAMYFGCAPIILCGMDLYTTGKVYCHKKDDFMGYKAIFDEPLEKLLADWRTLLPYRGSQNIKALSGPLQNVFGAYQ
jgi:hypothetical protein